MYYPQTIDFPKIIPGDLDDDPGPKQMYDKCHWAQLTEAEHRVCRARYYGAISWMDSNVGKALERIDSLGLAEKTLIIYSSDYGDMAGEKGMWFKQVMFDSVARVPFLMRFPGKLIAGKKYAGLINHVDYFSTFAGLVQTGADVPGNVTGKDDSQAIFGHGAGPEYSFTVSGIQSVDTIPEVTMARSRDWKCIQYAGEESNTYVLYDMVNDPDEITNLASNPKYQDIVGRHRQAIDVFLKSLKKPDFPIEKMPKGKKGEAE